MGDKENGKNGDRLTNKEYTKELRSLQAELCKLQYWVKYKGLNVIIIFEGRDAARKGGTIRAITERVSPRVFRVVALARLNCIAHLLSMIPYKKVPGEKVKLPSRDMRKRYDDQAPLKGRHSIPEVY
jgi:polyphosphate kinase 2 (PPK2 family)